MEITPGSLNLIQVLSQLIVHKEFYAKKFEQKPSYLWAGKL